MNGSIDLAEFSWKGFLRGYSYELQDEGILVSSQNFDSHLRSFHPYNSFPWDYQIQRISKPKRLIGALAAFAFAVFTALRPDGGLFAGIFFGGIGFATALAWHYSRVTFAVFHSPHFSGSGSTLVIRTPPSRLDDLHHFVAAIRRARLSQIKSECTYILQNFQGNLEGYSFYLKERGLIDEAAYMELKEFIRGYSEQQCIPWDVTARTPSSRPGENE